MRRYSHGIHHEPVLLVTSSVTCEYVPQVKPKNLETKHWKFYVVIIILLGFLLLESRCEYMARRSARNQSVRLGFSPRVFFAFRRDLYGIAVAGNRIHAAVLSGAVTYVLRSHSS